MNGTRTILTSVPDFVERINKPTERNQTEIEKVGCAVLATTTKTGVTIAGTTAAIMSAPVTRGLSLFGLTLVDPLSNFVADKVEKGCHKVIEYVSDSKNKSASENTYHITFSEHEVRQILESIDESNALREAYHNKAIQERIGRLSAEIERERIKADCQKILKQNNLLLNQLTHSEQEKFIEIIRHFHQQEQKKIAKEKMISNRALQQHHLDNAQSVFSGIQSLSTLVMTRDSELGRGLQMISIVGEQGISIAKNAMNLTRAASNMMLPAGIGLLFPAANIAIATASILFTLLGEEEDRVDHTYEALKKISQQIESLRCEMYYCFQSMHKRFDQVDKKLLQIYEKVIKGYERIEEVINQNSDNLREIITVSSGNIRRDIDELKETTEDRAIQIRLDGYKTLISGIKYNIDREAEIEGINKDVNVLEQVWLLDNFCNGFFTGMYKSSHSYRQISKIASVDGELNLGYLAEIAKEKLKLKPIPETQLPSLSPWIAGIELVLQARIYTKQRDKKDIHPSNLKRLNNIKTKAINAIQFIDFLSENSLLLYQNLFSMYKQGLELLEAKILEALIAEANKIYPTKMEALELIELKSIFPRMQSEKNNELDASHFLSKMKDAHFQIPTSLQYAQTMGLGKWRATYEIELSKPNITSSSNGSLPNRVTTISVPRKPTYKIQLSFIPQDEEIIPILNVCFKTNLPSREETFFRNSWDEDLVFKKNYMASQSNISIDKLWSRSTKASEINYDPVTTFPNISYFVQKAWSVAKTGKASDNFVKIINALKKERVLFDDFIDQMNAARILCSAYGQVIGLPRSIIENISNALIVDLNSLLNNPALFNIKIDQLMELISSKKTCSTNPIYDKKSESMDTLLSSRNKKTQPVYSSVIRLKLITIQNLIESTAEYLTDRIIGEKFSAIGSEFEEDESKEQKIDASIRPTDLSYVTKGMFSQSVSSSSLSSMIIKKQTKNMPMKEATVPMKRMTL